MELVRRDSLWINLNYPSIEKEIQKATYYNLLNNINTLEVMLTEKEEKDGHLLPPNAKLQM